MDLELGANRFHLALAGSLKKDLFFRRITISRHHILWLHFMATFLLVILWSSGGALGGLWGSSGGPLGELPGWSEKRKREEVKKKRREEEKKEES